MIIDTFERAMRERMPERSRRVSLEEAEMFCEYETLVILLLGCRQWEHAVRYLCIYRRCPRMLCRPGLEDEDSLCELLCRIFEHCDGKECTKKMGCILERVPADSPLGKCCKFQRLRRDMRRTRDWHVERCGDGEDVESGEKLHVLCRQGEDEESSCEDPCDS